MMQHKYLTFIAFTLLFNAVSHPAYATQETTDPYQGMLLGDVGGMRSKLSNTGVDISLQYRADVWSNLSGGIKRGQNYLDNLDIKFGLDGEKLLGLKNNRAMIYFINNNGSHPNASRIGSVQGIDNIEVGTDTFKLYEAYDEQTFFDDSLSILVGLRDLNAEFAQTDMTANFIKPTMQIGQSFAQTGRNGPSIFPNTSLATRIKVQPTQESYLSVAAFDAVPNNPNKPHGTQVDLRFHDGFLLVSEAGITPTFADNALDAPNKFAVGGWIYTQKMDDLVRVDSNGAPVAQRSAGAYFLSSYQFYSDQRAGRNVGAFFRAGIADGNTAQVDWDIETGLVGNGWIKVRPESELGVGFSQSHNGDNYIRSVSGASDRNEYGFELYYRDKIIDGINVQPDLQYIINPGTDKVTDDALVAGIRFDINF